MLVSDRRKETNILKIKVKEKYIKDYVERETTVARKRVENTKRAIKPEQEDMRIAERGGLSSREPGHKCDDMLDAISDNLSDLTSSDIKVDGEDDEDTGLRMRSEDDKPGWVMGTQSKFVQQCMKRFRQKQIMPEKLTQL
jgi:hypothetical protein